MATSFAHTHTHSNTAGISFAPDRRGVDARLREPGMIAKFVCDLFEDIRQRPLQDAKFAKHDMFREHIHAMSICYFALILLLIAGAIFMLPALIPILTQ